MHSMTVWRRCPADSLLLPILLVAGLLRFGLLSQRGFLYWDEGKFALEGVRLLSILHALPYVDASVLAGKAVGTAKPTHALLIAMSYGIVGVHDYAPLLLNALASTIEVVLLFVLARVLFGVRIALVASALLAISGYDIVYARSALSESDADLLFLLGVVLWLCGHQWSARNPAWFSVGRANRVIAAMVWGLAFTTNYRLIVYIATAVVLDLGASFKNSGWRGVLESVAVWGVGLSVAPVVWQVVGVLAQAHGVILFRGEITYRPTSYFGEAMYQLHGGKQSVFHFKPLVYMQWYVLRQGWWVCVLLVSGLVFAAIERSYRWLVPVSLVLIPYVVYVFAPFVVPRNLDPVLPFTALISAAGLVRVVDKILLPRLRPVGLATAAVILSAVGILHAWPLISVRSGFAEAAGYVQQHRSSGALVENEVMVFYLRDPGRGCDAPRIPAHPAALAAADDGMGGDFAIVDQYSSSIARYLARHARRVVRFPATGLAPLYEDLIASENGRAPGHGRRYVDVYSLDSLHLDKTGTAPPLYCTLDRLA